MNILTVKINGMEYALKGEEKEEYLLTLASYVDKKLKNIMNINPRLNTTSAAVLTAVNTIDEVFKQRDAYEKISKEVEDLKKQLTNKEQFDEELKDLKIQLINMDKVNGELNEKLKNSNDEIEVQLKEIIQEQLKELEELRNINKEIKFQNQSAKYKILDLQQKLMDSQIEVTKTKKQISDINNKPFNKKKSL